MRITCIVAVLVHFFLITHALLPVKDFRVKGLANEIQGVKSRAVVNSWSEQVLSYSPDVVFTSLNNTQVLYTDDTNSIYYIYLILDNGHGYKQRFPLLLDTGSAVSWIYNQSCTSNSCQNNNVTKFNYNGNLKLGSTFSIAYTNDQVDGTYISITENNINMQLGRVTSDFKVQDFSLGLTSDSPSIFNGFSVSGILGITTDSSDENIVSQMYDSGLINKKVFGLYLTNPGQIYRGNAPAKELGGVVLFGQDVADNTKKFIGSNTVNYVDIVDNNNNYWLINISDTSIVSSQGESSNVISDSRLTIIDSGTTGIVFPFDDAVAIHKQLFGDTGYLNDQNGNFAFLCDYTNENIVFNVGGTKLSVSSSNFKGQAYTDPSLFGYCASKIQGLDNYGHWVLGQAFLKSFYTVFDLDTNQIGFGQANLQSFGIEFGNESSSSASSSVLPTTCVETSTKSVLTTITHVHSSSSAEFSSSQLSTSVVKNGNRSNKTHNTNGTNQNTFSFLGLPIIFSLLTSILIL